MSSVSTVRSSSIAGETYCQLNNARHSETSACAAPPHSARKYSSAIIAGIKRSHTDRAGTVIAPSATAEREMSGCVIGPLRFCRYPIATSFSRYLTNWLRWRFKIQGSSMASYFVPWPNLSSKWPPIQNDWEPELAFSPSCTLGLNGSNTTRMSIV